MNLQAKSEEERFSRSSIFRRAIIPRHTALRCIFPPKVPMSIGRSFYESTSSSMGFRAQDRILSRLLCLGQKIFEVDFGHPHLHLRHIPTGRWRVGAGGGTYSICAAWTSNRWLVTRLGEEERCRFFFFVVPAFAVDQSILPNLRQQGVLHDDQAEEGGITLVEIFSNRGMALKRHTSLIVVHVGVIVRCVWGVFDSNEKRLMGMSDVKARSRCACTSEKTV